MRHGARITYGPNETPISASRAADKALGAGYCCAVAAVELRASWMLTTVTESLAGS